MGFTEFIKPDVNINFMKLRYPALIGSGVLVLTALILIFVVGFTFGIEFAGGVEVRVKIAGDVSASDIRQALKEKGVEGISVHEYVDLANVYSVKIKGDDLAKEVSGKGLADEAGVLLHGLEEKFGKENVEHISTDSIGPRVGKTLRKKGLYAILFSLAGILIYIGFRFNFRYAPGAVAALAHDVILTAGIFVILKHEISLSVIAAFLTIAGYSINDTIIVFDRIREGTARRHGKTLTESVNGCINQTLSRTILTSVTTMLVVVSLYILGGEILRDFAFAMIIGIVVGTYSSVFIASPIFIALEEFNQKRRKVGKRRRR
jgi:preprotein translocase subunit SecF